MNRVHTKLKPLRPYHYMPFGKYKGYLLRQIEIMDPQYIEWLKTTECKLNLATNKSVEKRVKYKLKVFNKSISSM